MADPSTPPTSPTNPGDRDLPLRKSDSVDKSASKAANVCVGWGCDRRLGVVNGGGVGFNGGGGWMDRLLFGACEPTLRKPL